MANKEERNPLLINTEDDDEDESMLGTPREGEVRKELERDLTLNMMQDEEEDAMRKRKKELDRERLEKEGKEKEKSRRSGGRRGASSSSSCIPHWMRCNFKDDLSPEVRFNSNWLQKWMEHGRFPWKFIFHALLAVACTALIFIQTMDLTPYSLDYSATWYHVFFPGDFEYQTGSKNSYYFFEIDEVNAIIDNALDKYQQYPNMSVNMNKHFKDKEEAKLTVRSYRDCDSVFNIHHAAADVSLVEKTYSISPENLGPLNKSLPWNETRHFYYCMSTMWLEFWIYNVHLEYSHPIAYKWGIQLVFDNTIQGGAISLTMNQEKSRDSSLHVLKLLLLTRIIFDIIIILLALVSQFLSWNSLSKSFKQYQRTRRVLAKRGTLHVLYPKTTWQSLPMKTKLRFFNMWFILTIIGNTCNIIGAVMDLMYAYAYGGGAHWQKLFTGLGTLLMWVNMTRYLEFDHKYVVLISTLQRGLPNAIRFTIGIAPIFIGFALFGLIYFSEISDRFSSFGEIFVTLVGLQIGDDVQYTIRSVDSEVWVGRIYMYCFLFLSVYTIANIFIAIMEEAFSYNVAVVETRKQSAATEVDLNQDEGLWNALLGLDKDVVKDDNSGGGDPHSSNRDLRRSIHAAHGHHFDPTAGSIAVPPVSFDDPTLSISNNNNNNNDNTTTGPQAPLDQDAEEIMQQIATIMEEQHKKYKAKTEQKIRMLLASRK